MVEFLMERVTFLETQLKLEQSRCADITQLKNDMLEVKKFMNDLSSGINSIAPRHFLSSGR